MRVQLVDDVILRPLEADDAPALLDAYLRNRAHLRPFDPPRPDSFWTLEGQRSRLSELTQQQQAGTALATAMLRDGRVLGCATFDPILRGALCSASLGYWVDAGELGQGLASVATAAMCRLAEAELGLHRVSASTSLANLASQRVLTKNGFERFGLAPKYVHINGRWQDSLLFQRILNDRAPDPR